MATQADVRRIALALPGTEEGEGHFGFSVRVGEKSKGFAWAWNERVAPKRPRVANPGVLAVRVPNLAQKELILASDPAKFFTEPHYNGFPAVLVRLDAVTVADLELLLEDAWRCQSPPAARAATRVAAKKTAAKTTAAKKTAAKKVAAKKVAAKKSAAKKSAGTRAR